MWSDRYRLGECTWEQHAFGICFCRESEEDFIALVEAIATESSLRAFRSYQSDREDIPSATMESNENMEAEIGQLSNDARREGSLSFFISYLQLQRSVGT